MEKKRLKSPNVIGKLAFLKHSEEFYINLIYFLSCVSFCQFFLLLEKLHRKNVKTVFKLSQTNNLLKFVLIKIKRSKSMVFALKIL